MTAPRPAPDDKCLLMVAAMERLARVHRLEDVFAVIRDTGREIAGADGVSIVLRDGPHCNHVDENSDHPLWKGRRIGLAQCASGWSILHNQTAVVPDVFADPRLSLEAYRDVAVRALIAVPLRFAEPFGALIFSWTRPRAFSPDDIASVEMLARAASAGAAAARLRLELTEREHRVSAVLEAGSFGTFEFDAASGLLVTSTACKAMFGSAPDVPLSLDDLLAAVGPAERDGLKALIGSGRRGDCVCRVQNAGEERVIEIRGGPVADAGGTRFAAVVRDITEQVRSKERADHARAELAHAARLNDLGAMASALAHELNQPLGAARTFLQAARRFQESDPSQVLQALAKADAQLLRTNAIIARIRGFVGKAQTTILPHDVGELMNDVVELAGASARHKGIRLDIDIDASLPKACMDRVQIQQVVFNLLRNAFEATELADTREVRVHATHGDGCIEIAVSDSGPGLAPAIADHLFEPFHTTKDGGMGVGLSLCRRIVESHGGRLWHDPGQGGATFRFSLPAAGQ